MFMTNGIAVTVPAPERYAIHKLIVSVSRHSDRIGAEKSFKGIGQAYYLIHALDLGRRSDELGEGWMEAWKRGPAWRECLERGVSRLDDEIKEILEKAIRKAYSLSKANLEDYCTQNTFSADKREPT